MDITLLFKACIKTVRTTNKNTGVQDPKSNILKIKTVDSNLKLAKEIIKQIKNLEDFLRKNKAAYLNVVNYTSSYQRMNEVDRGKLDTAAEEIINSSRASIKRFKTEIEKENKSKQKYEHYVTILNSLDRYLKDVSRIYTEAKATRVKRVVEAHKISKLEHKTSKKNGEVEPSDHNKQTNDQNKGSFKNITNSLEENEDNYITVEEMQMFKSENELLYSELNSLSDEVRQMESKVVHIAELQELFTEKVLQQEKDIDRIATVVAGATDNMKDANEQIRQAIQRNAGLRIWLLFFLLVMSFSLLFLDWYND